MKLPPLKNTKILVIGDVMLDRYLHGETSRISPEAPVPIVHIERTDLKPGGAANVALNISTLGAKVFVVGLIGEDESGKLLTSSIEATSINSGLISLNGASTITKSRVISRQQQLIRLDVEDGFGGVNHSQILKSAEEHLTHADALILSDYNKGTITPILGELISLANNNKVSVFADPKVKDFSVYKNTTVLTPNMSEFEAAVGKCSSDDEIVSKAYKVVADLNLEALLLTRSEKGMTLIEKDNKVTHLSAQVREVFDVTGAGDTVIAVLATLTAAGSNILEAAKVANLAAGLVVGKLGAASVTVDELEST